MTDEHADRTGSTNSAPTAARDVAGEDLAGLVAALTSQPAPLRAPSAEGITLWGGLHSHGVNGELAKAVDDAIDHLVAKPLQNGTADSD